MAVAKILVIEDERDIADLIAFNLKQEGYQVELVYSGEEGFDQAKEILPDLILLDIMLPGMNGLDVCRNLRAETNTKNIPIIMLTAKNEDIDVVTGLELGADDYITKPFSPKILISRIRSLLRRQQRAAAEKPSVLKQGDLLINPEKHQVKVQGESIALTQTEFALLCLLAKKPGWVFSRSQLIDSLREGHQVITERAIDVQILNLRKKLGVCGEYIETVRGAGYRLREML